MKEIHFRFLAGMKWKKLLLKRVEKKEEMNLNEMFKLFMINRNGSSYSIKF